MITDYLAVWIAGLLVLVKGLASLAVQSGDQNPHQKRGGIEKPHE
jgi:hypothetical protein